MSVAMRFFGDVHTIAKRTALEEAAAYASTQRLRSELNDLQVRFDAKERMLLSEAKLKHELLKAELSQEDEAISSTKRQMLDDISTLEKQREQYQRLINELRADLDERRERLQAFKMAADEERSVLTREIESLRRELERAQNAVSTSPSVAKELSNRYESKTNDFGMTALNNVREQLREIREASGSPARLVQKHVLPIASPNQPKAAVPSSGAHSNDSPVNSWRSRLMKLQGDLKDLRADIGAH
jgi:chromosome segregation ATPase